MKKYVCIGVLWMAVAPPLLVQAGSICTTQSGDVVEKEQQYFINALERQKTIESTIIERFIGQSGQSDPFFGDERDKDLVEIALKSAEEFLFPDRAVAAPSFLNVVNTLSGTIVS